MTNDERKLHDEYSAMIRSSSPLFDRDEDTTERANEIDAPVSRNEEVQTTLENQR